VKSDVVDEKHHMSSFDIEIDLQKEKERVI
jgi:hypothetical protein